MMLYPHFELDSTKTSVDNQTDPCFVKFYQDISFQHRIIDYHQFHHGLNDEKQHTDKHEQHHDEQHHDEQHEELSRAILICFPLSPKPHELHVEADEQLIRRWKPS